MIKFAKGHAYGNDFLYVLSRDADGVRLDRFAQEICDRHTGVGADGLIIYEPTCCGRVDAAVQRGRQPGRGVGQRRPSAWSAVIA